MRTYEPIRMIGMGGMGEVYEGRMQLALAQEEPCAIKLIRKDRSDDPTFQVMFAREATASMRIRHPHIVGAHDFGVASDGRLFLILDLVRGPSLSAAFDLIDGDPAVVARIARDALLALQHLHESQLIHRDISPSNILIDRGGRAMVSDLGVVKRVSGSGSGGIRGVAAYAAPEVRAGGESTPASDLYSLGVVLYELLTGELPPLPMKRRARRKPLTLSENIPAALAQAVLGSLHPAPDQRLTVDAALRLLEGGEMATGDALTTLADEWLAMQADAPADPDDPAPEADSQATPLNMHGAVLQLAKSNAAPKRIRSRRAAAVAVAVAVAAVAALGIAAGVVATQSSHRASAESYALEWQVEPAPDTVQESPGDPVEISMTDREEVERAEPQREGNPGPRGRKRTRLQAALLE